MRLGWGREIILWQVLCWYLVNTSYLTYNILPDRSASFDNEETEAEGSETLLRVI